jgi:cytidylate kinase
VADVAALEGLEEKPAGWWSRIASVVSGGAPDGQYVPPPPRAVHEGELFEVERRIIREIANRESAVIVGRGAPHVLHDHPNVLRVFVHAPAAHRIAEAQRVYRIDAAAARDMVQRSDRHRARFVQDLIGRSWTDACLYDLTIDSSAVAIEMATAWIVQVLRLRL